jgi:hypothetical protein
MKDTLIYKVIKQEFIRSFGEDGWETHWSNHCDDDVMLVDAIGSIIQFGKPYNG